MSIVTNEAEAKNGESKANGLDQEKFAGVIRIDEQEVRSHVEEVVRKSVEETLNGLLDAAADDRLCANSLLPWSNDDGPLHRPARRWHRPDDGVAPSWCYRRHGPFLVDLRKGWAGRSTCDWRSTLNTVRSL